MSKRLQVVVDDEQFTRFQKVASVQGMTLSEWVRQTLRAGEREVSTADVERKLAAIERAANLNLGPSPDIETMIAEIESGYKQDLPGLE
jgi:hypothetical protein